MVCVLAGGVLPVEASRMIVADGEPRAEIVIAPVAGRTVRLAAQELQDSVAKMSGARLPIRFESSGGAEVVLYVGESEATKRLGVVADDLEAGAWRIASGDGWMVFIGDDTLFEPREPWARSNGQIRNGWLQEQWEAAGGVYGVPNGGLYKNQWRRVPANMGLPEDVEVDPQETLTIWGFDEHGSFNAVCGWLYSLGMRWYMPGEIGEVVPALRSIPFEPVNTTVRPDFQLRQFNVRYSIVGEDAARWTMRLGLRADNRFQIAHGLATMTSRQEVFDSHPEWFALYDGKRRYDPHSSKNQLCYGNEELLEAAVRYAQAQFDIYGFDAVSIMPPDGYTRICECPLCAGKESPELGTNGTHSNYIWEFVNEVARRVVETHPDKVIVNCAYNRYREPPSSIDKLEPNVQVVLVGGRRPMSNDPESLEANRRWREAWSRKTDRPIAIFENYPFTDRGTYMPMFTATSIARTINETKGQSLGEDIWMSIGNEFATKDIGFNHFPFYFTAIMYWGGPERDVRPLLEEYCQLFYGPAGDRMLEFFDYCETNWQRMGADKDAIDHALALFDSAVAEAPTGSVYARRLALLADFLTTLRSKSSQLGRVRGPIPTLRTVYSWRGPVVIDGVLDENEWVNNPGASTVGLREMQAGGAPTFATTVKAVWIGKTLYLAIRCEEPSGELLNITTDKDGDRAIFEGDVIRILIETDSRSFYEIAVNPAGAILDLDHSASAETADDWNSQVKVATRVADDHWTVEMEIPVTDDDSDPLHRVIGRMPSASLPWFINIVRQRVREDGIELSAFSPTASDSPYDPMYFGRLYDGRSSAYNAAEPEYNFIQAMQKARDLARSGDRQAAIDVLVEQATGNVSDFQRSLALAEAVRQTRGARDNEQAARLLQQIPIEAVALTLEMEQLIAQRKADEVVARFSDDMLNSWPFWQRGQAYRVRAAARAATGDKAGAIEDYRAALVWTGDKRERERINTTLTKLTGE